MRQFTHDNMNQETSGQKKYDYYLEWQVFLCKRQSNNTIYNIIFSKQYNEERCKKRKITLLQRKQ